MTSADPGAGVRRLEEDEAALFREIRLEGLRLAPEAYGSAFAVEDAKPLVWFQERLRDSEVFGAFRAGTIVGIAGFVVDSGPKRRHIGHLWGVYVRPDERGRGTGRQLCEAVVATARRQVEVMQLTVMADNAPARRLYRELGFVEFGVERKARKVAGVFYDDIHMARDFTQA
jgi:ribosomal protein S18 acetylase RimI-like enzyme